MSEWLLCYAVLASEAIFTVRTSVQLIIQSSPSARGCQRPIVQTWPTNRIMAFLMERPVGLFSTDHGLGLGGISFISERNASYIPCIYLYNIGTLIPWGGGACWPLGHMYTIRVMYTTDIQKRASVHPADHRGQFSPSFLTVLWI